MAFSMHSHSGEFCPGHAKDNLEEVIQTAIARGMKTFALTEHMPRMEDADLYPEEIEANHTISILLPRHHSFITHACHLRTKYSSQITILIGFEAEWIRSSYHSLITTLSSDPAVDFFIGSVHHVHEIPIDYDKSFYAKAVERAGSEEKLFEDYFDAQFEMMQVTKSRVVGHFDLIRLMAEEPDAELKSKKGVWEKIVRNLEAVVEQGALLEVNTSALRKGLKEPYPKGEICEEFLKMGGKFTLSDDSHGIAQVGTNYVKAFDFLESVRIGELWTFDKGENGDLGEKAVKLQDIRLSFRERFGLLSHCPAKFRPIDSSDPAL